MLAMSACNGKFSLFTRGSFLLRIFEKVASAMPTEGVMG